MVLNVGHGDLKHHEPILLEKQGGHEQKRSQKTCFLVFTSLLGQKERNKRQFQSDLFFRLDL